MISRKDGHIVNVASLAGHSGTNKLVDYCASKFAAVGLDESLRVELFVQVRSEHFLSGAPTLNISPFLLRATRTTSKPLWFALTTFPRECLQGFR